MYFSYFTGDVNINNYTKLNILIINMTINFIYKIICTNNFKIINKRNTYAIKNNYSKL